MRGTSLGAKDNKLRRIPIRVASLLLGIWVGVFGGSQFSHPFKLAIGASIVVILGMLILVAIGKARKRYSKLKK